MTIINIKCFHLYACIRSTYNLWVERFPVRINHQAGMVDYYKIRSRAGEVTQQLKTLATLSEDPD